MVKQENKSWWWWFQWKRDKGRELKIRERGERSERIDMDLGYIILLGRYIILKSRIGK